MPLTKQRIVSSPSSILSPHDEENLSLAIDAFLLVLALALGLASLFWPAFLATMAGLVLHGLQVYCRDRGRRRDRLAFFLAGSLAALIGCFLLPIPGFFVGVVWLIAGICWRWRQSRRLA